MCFCNVVYWYGSLNTSSVILYAESVYDDNTVNSVRDLNVDSILEGDVVNSDVSFNVSVDDDLSKVRVYLDDSMEGISDVYVKVNDVAKRISY